MCTLREKRKKHENGSKLFVLNLLTAWPTKGYRVGCLFRDDCRKMLFRDDCSFIRPFLTSPNNGFPNSEKASKVFLPALRESIRVGPTRKAVDTPRNRSGREVVTVTLLFLNQKGWSYLFKTESNSLSTISCLKKLSDILSSPAPQVKSNYVIRLKCFRSTISALKLRCYSTTENHPCETELMAPPALKLYR